MNVARKARILCGVNCSAKAMMWCNAIRLEMLWKYVLNVLWINCSTSETVTLIDVGRGDFDVKANMGTQIRGAMWD